MRGESSTVASRLGYPAFWGTGFASKTRERFGTAIGPKPFTLQCWTVLSARSDFISATGDALHQTKVIQERVFQAFAPTVVVQENSFREIPDLVSLVKRFGFRQKFSRIVSWGTFSGLEFSHRDVHNPKHPLHAEFQALLLETGISKEVFMGNVGAF